MKHAFIACSTAHAPHDIVVTFLSPVGAIYSGRLYGCYYSLSIPFIKTYRQKSLLQTIGPVY